MPGLLNITPDQWLLIAEKHFHPAQQLRPNIVVSHGTDTMKLYGLPP